MDPMLLLGLAVAVVIVAAAALVIASRRRPDNADSGLATSTEGLKICPNCGMGNLWTERACSACGNPLRG